MKSLVVKRSAVISGRKTSVSVEAAFWEALKQIATHRCMTLSALLTTINAERHHGNLSSAIRLRVLEFYRSRLLGDNETEARDVTISSNLMYN
jgi:predicted DNA-binding ribbon-helix-helix protein